MNKNEDTIEKYFSAWKNQNVSNLGEIFTQDAHYIVRPFGLEKYVGLEAIVKYWQDNSVSKQVDPNPYIITKVIHNDTAFIEWQCDYKNQEQEPKQMRGMMVLEFKDGLIMELREHYESQKSP